MDTQVRKTTTLPGIAPEVEYEVENTGKAGYIDIGLTGDCLEPGKKVIRFGKKLNRLVQRHVDAGNLKVRALGTFPAAHKPEPPPPPPVAPAPVAEVSPEPAPAPPAPEPPPRNVISDEAPPAAEAAPEPAEEAPGDPPAPRSHKGGRGKK